MKRQNIRVMLASEYPEMRSLLKGVIEEQEKAVIVGQAENASRALTLARSLRPDVVVIDTSLPYAVGLDSSPLTRTSGLDVAQALSEEIPNIKVVLLSTLDEVALTKRDWVASGGVYLCRERLDACVPFTLVELRKEVTSGTLVFARVESKPKMAHKLKVATLCDDAILLGALGIGVGASLIVSLVLLMPGVVLALAGLVTLFLGVAGGLLLEVFKK